MLMFDFSVLILWLVVDGVRYIFLVFLVRFLVLVMVRNKCKLERVYCIVFYIFECLIENNLILCVIKLMYYGDY